MAHTFSSSKLNSRMFSPDNNLHTNDEVSTHWDSLPKEMWDDSIRRSVKRCKTNRVDWETGFRNLSGDTLKEILDISAPEDHLPICLAVPSFRFLEHDRDYLNLSSFSIDDKLFLQALTTKKACSLANAKFLPRIGSPTCFSSALQALDLTNVRIRPDLLQVVFKSCRLLEILILDGVRLDGTSFDVDESLKVSVLSLANSVGLTDCDIMDKMFRLMPNVIKLDISGSDVNRESLVGMTGKLNKNLMIFLAADLENRFDDTVLQALVSSCSALQVLDISNTMAAHSPNVFILEKFGELRDLYIDMPEMRKYQLDAAAVINMRRIPNLKHVYMNNRLSDEVEIALSVFQIPFVYHSYPMEKTRQRPSSLFAEELRKGNGSINKNYPDYQLVHRGYFGGRNPLGNTRF